MQILGQTLRFDVYQGISVKQNGLILNNAWVGGMNAMQYQSMDLNGDNVLDLVTFDRTSQQISTFLQDQPGNFTFAPQYVNKFPHIENWFVLSDFNQDGRTDLFCATGAGIKVYQNQTVSGQMLFELVKDPLLTLGFSGMVNLYVAAPDIPVIADVDSDGDVDILAFEPGGHYIEFHENVSMQKTGKAGLVFEKSAQNWGNIVHYDCREAQILNSDIRRQSIGQLNRVDHVGNTLGRSSTNDLFMGHVSCSNLAFLKNVGTNQQTKYSNFDFDFLNGFPAVTGVFYSATPLQLIGNKEEIFVSVNTSDNAGFRQDFQHSSFRITSGQAKPFLQDQMIDVGERASPCLYDVDSDGDLDLLIAHAGYWKWDDVRSSIYLYENQSGVLVFNTADYLGLSSRFALSDLVLQMNGDQLLLIGQSSVGTKVFQWSNQQWSPISMDLNFGEIPINSPYGYLVLKRSGQIQSATNSDWGELSKESWQLRTCQFADVDGDGREEFIAIDQEGNWHVGNFDASRNHLAWRSIDVHGFKVGRNARLQVVDFNRDGRLDFVVGTGGGGVYLLANNSSSPVWDALQTQPLQVWPNPSSGLIHVLTNEPGTLQVFNHVGQMLINIQTQAGKTYDLMVSNMSLLRFVDANGKVTTRKTQGD